jgi:hypothetical protein
MLDEMNSFLHSGPAPPLEIHPYYSTSLTYAIPPRPCPTACSLHPTSMIALHPTPLNNLTVTVRLYFHTRPLISMLIPQQMIGTTIVSTLVYRARHSPPRRSTLPFHTPVTLPFPHHRLTVSPNGPLPRAVATPIMSHAPRTLS